MSSASREAVAALSRRVELDDVRYHAVSGVAKEPASEADEASQSFQVLLGSDEHSFAIRCRVEFDTPDALYVVDASIRYVCDEPLGVDQPVLAGFAEHIGILALYPYLRAAVHDMSSRLNLGAAIMPIIRAGTLDLGDPESVDETATAEDQV